MQLCKFSSFILQGGVATYGQTDGQGDYYIHPKTLFAGV